MNKSLAQTLNTIYGKIVTRIEAVHKALNEADFSYSVAGKELSVALKDADWLTYDKALDIGALQIGAALDKGRFSDTAKLTGDKLVKAKTARAKRIKDTLRNAFKAAGGKIPAKPRDESAQAELVRKQGKARKALHDAKKEAIKGNPALGKKGNEDALLEKAKQILADKKAVLAEVETQHSVLEKFAKGTISVSNTNIAKLASVVAGNDAEKETRIKLAWAAFVMTVRS